MMKGRQILPALALIALAIFWQSGHTQDELKAGEAPSKLSEYHFAFRGKMSGQRGTRPEQIAQMDNNGEILIACREAKTSDRLNSLGIKFTQSQLELLTDWNLLTYDRKTKEYTTTIHIYGPDKAVAIRKHVQSAVDRLADALSVDLASLKSQIEQLNSGKNLFSVLYAYILHDYSMRQFGEELYQKPQLSVEKPFWNGFAWAIYPICRFDIGVFTLPGQENRFFFVSSDAVPGPDYQQMMALVKDVTADNKVDDPDLAKTLSQFGLCDAQGELTILRLDSDWTIKLESMAKKIYAATILLADSPEMKTILGMETRAQAAMFLHYELRYAFLKSALEKGIIEAPIDFDNASNNTPGDKKYLVFMIKN
jgi:hypothetical protein